MPAADTEWVQRQESNLLPRAYEARDLTVCPLCNKAVSPAVNGLSHSSDENDLCMISSSTSEVLGDSQPPGAPSEIRTPDQCLKRTLLCQLS